MNRDAEQLNGWKEIACYMNRSVRCVQRWERNENLPVRRHGHRRGVSVYALRGELNAWWDRECLSSEQFNAEPRGAAIKHERPARELIHNEATPLTEVRSEFVTANGRQAEFALAPHEVAAIRFLLTLLRAGGQIKSIVPR